MANDLYSQLIQSICQNCNISNKCGPLAANSRYIRFIEFLNKKNQPNRSEELSKMPNSKCLLVLYEAQHIDKP